MQMVGVKSKIVRFFKLSIEKWNSRLNVNKAEVNAGATLPNMMKNVPGDTLSPLLICRAHVALTLLPP